jgi:primosomal protein N' (replication factor Y) (superfamily II helicase)
MQVAGRAGRADKAGEVLIQTAFPDHVLFNALREQDYPAFANSLLQEREMMQFPPYSYIALLKAEANDFALVQRFLKFAADSAHAMNLKVMVYDPVRPQMERLKGMERGQLLMQANSRQPLQRLLKTLVMSLREHSLNAKVRWAVDVDPLEV